MASEIPIIIKEFNSIRKEIAEAKKAGDKNRLELLYKYHYWLCKVASGSSK